MKKRCAIYTRKSTEEGLDQAFNSLDAQHDACTAFIASQKHEGWTPTKARYDDGGYSGGTMERPGLQKLLDDIRANRVDVVVVYKIDRLTRSLTDFARIVEVFDAHEVSFVSVTQQFNTTTSMGRLTLNVLLSFAQFEREVTAERIRDKIAASKKKGMWMGGVVPLGYDARDKKLVVNEAEAETVRTLFKLYLELGTVRQLKDEADRRGIVTKCYVQDNGNPRGGKSFSRGHLYRVLANPLYRGMIQHRGVLHEGEHEVIVDEATWNAVRNTLTGNAPVPKGSRTNGGNHTSLLTGLVFDEAGDRLSPSHAVKKGKRYRYYISKRLKGQPRSEQGGWRLPAEEFEGTVISVVTDALRDVRGLQQTLGLGDLGPDQVAAMDRAASKLADALERAVPSRQKQLLATILNRIELQSDRLSIELDRPALASRLLGGAPDQMSEAVSATLSAPFAFKRRGFEGKLVIGNNPPRDPDRYLIGTIAMAHRVLDQFVDDGTCSLRDLAQRNGMHPADLGHLLPLAFLAPDIVEAILAGQQPADLTAKHLKRSWDLPMDWAGQRRFLGFGP